LNINPDFYVKATDELQTKEEQDELGLMAVGYYAILETAYRKKNRLSIEEHREKISHMYAEFSEIAEICKRYKTGKQRESFTSSSI